ncbi:MAG: hydantoinase/oxoprolinase family protein [Desulfobacterales bacterium]|nr:hydantoinase/oxoprolinase family protein [Desulfobacterales bacterium]
MNKSKSYGLGIDTGGTYTDAVILDLSTRKVVKSAKTPSTHADLGMGIGNVLKALFTDLALHPSEITTIAVSTTLATNAVIENMGARVALFVIGPVKHFDLPAVSVSHIEGGHNYLGEEEKNIDIEMLYDRVLYVKDNVDAYAVTAAMSIKNPAHEKVAKKALEMLDPNKPVFCSYHASTLPGIQERAATTVLNARLLPTMQSFLQGVDSTLTDLSVTNDLVVIRGDAQPMDLQKAVNHAADTFASGPAASICYGSSFSQTADAVIVDVGGTTTDISIIRNNYPVISTDGCQIGKWQTHVNAVDMYTVGCGGDSLISFKENRIEVGPKRVMPVSMVPEVPDSFNFACDDILHTYLVLNEKSPCQFDDSDPLITALRQKGGASFIDLKEELNLTEFGLEQKINDFFKNDLILQVGFTPTDALHALGQMNFGNHEVAAYAAQNLAKQFNLTSDQFCEAVIDAAAQKIEEAILAHVIRRELGLSMSDFLVKSKNHRFLSIDFSLKLPIIAIGAAAKKLLPAVGERLNTEVIFPDHYEVGNAIGALLIALENKKQL